MSLMTSVGCHYYQKVEAIILNIEKVVLYLFKIFQIVKVFLENKTCAYFSHIACLFWYSHLLQVWFRLAMPKVKDIEEETPRCLLSSYLVPLPPTNHWCIPCLSFSLSFLCVAGKQVQFANCSWRKGGGGGVRRHPKILIYFHCRVNKCLTFQLLGVCGLFALCRRGSDSGRTDIRVFNNFQIICFNLHKN